MARREIYGFDERTAGTLKKVANRSRLSGSGQPGVSTNNLSAANASAVWLMITTSPITARSGKVPGSGTARIVYRSGGQIVEHSDAAGDPVTGTVYSYHTREIAQGTYILVTRDLRGSLWAIHFTDGGPSDESGGDVDPGWEPGDTECLSFLPGTTPKRITVDIAGVNNNACSDCREVIDGTYTLTQSDYQPCRWLNQDGETGACSGWQYIQLDIGKLANWFGGNNNLYVALRLYDLDSWATTWDMTYSDVYIPWGQVGPTTLDGKSLDLLLTYNEQLSGGTSCTANQSQARVRT